MYADDTVIAGINDIKIMYNGNIWKTVDDFKTHFGEGTKEGNYIKYNDDFAELVITLKNNDIYNIEWLCQEKCVSSQYIIYKTCQRT